MRHTELPLAAHGLISYRYNGRYGYIMIGAKDDADALKQAGRSTDDEIKPENLEVWDGKRYVRICKHICCGCDNCTGDRAGERCMCFMCIKLGLYVPKVAVMPATPTIGAPALKER